MSEKPFEPTPHRLARTRREGDVARPGEAASLAAVVAAAACVPVAMLPSAFFGAAIATGSHGRPPTGFLLASVACAGLPALAAAAAATGATLWLGGGPALRFPRIECERLAPWKGFARIFSRETALALAKAVLFASAFTLAAWPVVRERLLAAARASQPPAIAAQTLGGARDLALIAGALGGLSAAADLFVQRRARLRRLRMSADELRRDQKESDGDPLVRGRRRRTHGALLTRSIERIAEAAFVVSNPTHVAVGLAYAPPTVAVPRIVVRAAGDLAREVKRRAAERGIPIVENVALARALYASGEVDGYIPRERYDDVARVVAALLRAGALG